MVSLRSGNSGDSAMADRTALACFDKYSYLGNYSLWALDYDKQFQEIQTA